MAVHSLSEASGDVYALGFANHVCSVITDMPLKERPSSVRFRQGLLSRVSVRMMPHRESTNLDPGSVKQCESRMKEIQLVGTNRGK